MSETVTKVVQGVDRLFDEIVVNGRTVKSRAPSTHTTQASPAPVAEPVEGQYVGAVQLNNVIHGLKDVPLNQRVANLETDVSGIEELIPSTASSSNKLTDKNYVDSADTSIRSDIGAEITALQNLVGAIQSRLTELNAMIPNQASAQNQLADKDFVNSSISTNTANFLGTYSTLAEIEAIQNPTNNDYAFLETTDASGNTVFDRYKYSGADNQWLFEYELNNSSFTAEQWATINSGLTQSSVDSDIASAISDEVADRNTAITNAITSLLAKIATQFSTSVTYVKDTYVSYNGRIYRCINNHPAGAWVSGDFTEVNLANDLMQIIKSMSGGSSIDMNEIAELFDIDKNSEFVGKLIPYSGNPVQVRVGGSLDYNKRITDVTNIQRGTDFCIFTLEGDDSSASSLCYADLAKGILYVKSLTSAGSISFGYVTYYCNSYQAQLCEALTGIDITGTLFVRQQFDIRNVMSTCYDSRRILALIYNGYVYYNNSSDGVTFSQSIAGNRVICVNNLFVISSANGIYTTYGMSWSPVQKSSLSASYICYGKNKFAMLHNNTVYYSDSLSTWLATTMTGVTELYFSCNKFVAKDSSGHIYYSEDLEEWKQSSIITTSGVFLDTIFTWGTNYTRDFINVQIISTDPISYTPRAIKGNVTYPSSYIIIGLTDLCAVVYARDTSSSSTSYLLYIASPIIVGGGSAIRFPLN